MTIANLSFPPFIPGQVWLVGAGPGDPGLLTLLGHYALGQADAVVYDALVDPRILAMAREGAEMVFAGKRGGKPSAKQPDISATLVRLAKEGKRVLRLKGGDPFVFGRGAEEARTLVESGVSFRVVPGITAGIAGPAYAGMPVTARQTNSAVAFITGCSASGEVPEDLDWESLARGAPVMVIYMGLKHLPLIVDKILPVRGKDEPCAVISQATTAGQRVLVSTLGKIAGEVENAAFEPPAIIVIGGAVGWREILNWG